ncbi:MAG: arginine N-succinyltransferase [Alphaproteobacteria bacterium]|nr:arginine N-succinyltransferase [Alphaproteobacteria bacterium]
MLIRPVDTKDHAEILELAKKAGIGMSSLPPDAEVLEQKIRNSMLSFSGTPERPNEESFLMVMEDTEEKRLVGTTGLVAHVGLSRPFYSYKLSSVVQANSELDIYSPQQVLHMVNDYTNASEIGSLFLLPDYRRDGLGRFLSRCRYLLLAEFPDLFSDIVIAEIRGVSTADGGAPFYNHLAQHFFHMTFAQADYISATMGNQFIADLMPKYPIYVNLLPQEAQDAIGQPLKDSAAAMRLLQREGFRYEGYIDVFDAGPTLQAEVSKVRAVQTSRRCEIEKIVDSLDASTYHMISTTDLENFAVCTDAVQITPEGSAIITQNTAKKLKVEKGHAIRFSPT